MNNKFIKRTYINFSVLFILFYIIIGILVFGFIKSGSNFFISFVLGAFSIIILVVIANFLDKAGIYVKNDEIYNKLWKYEHVNISDIEAVKILKTSTPSRYFSYLKNYNVENSKIKSEYLYTMVFVDKYEDKMGKYSDDTLFISEYNKNVVFCCIYDKDFLSIC